MTLPVLPICRRQRQANLPIAGDKGNYRQNPMYTSNAIIVGHFIKIQLMSPPKKWAYKRSKTWQEKFWWRKLFTTTQQETIKKYTHAKDFPWTNCYLDWIHISIVEVHYPKRNKIEFMLFSFWWCIYIWLEFIIHLSCSQSMKGTDRSGILYVATSLVFCR